MRMFVTSDGYPFYEQPDGSVTDTPIASECDMGWTSVEEMLSDNDEDYPNEATIEATLDQRKEYCKIRYNHKTNEVTQ